MQPLALTTAGLAAYHARVQDSHDFSIEVDVLNLDEELMGTAQLIDGQVNIQTDATIRRTATMTLSDPDGALDFTEASAYSGTSLWADRLVRVRHLIDVPGFGTVTTVPFIGVPSSLSRRGSEVTVELQDKTALSARGAIPKSYPKGTNAITAIKHLLQTCTGEFRFRLPTTTRKLSKAYVAGLLDENSPWLVAQKIASAELSMQLIMSCDGYVIVRKKPTVAVATFTGVTEQAQESIDFNQVANYVRVTGKGKVKAVTKALSTNSLSATRLQRKGVLRYLPLVIEEPGLTTNTKALARAKTELGRALGVADLTGVSVVPMFHLDVDDKALVWVAGSTTTVALTEASIPLGVGGDMTIGGRRWVSKPVLVHT